MDVDENKKKYDESIISLPGLQKTYDEAASSLENSRKIYQETMLQVEAQEEELHRRDEELKKHEAYIKNEKEKLTFLKKEARGKKLLAREALNESEKRKLDCEKKMMDQLVNPGPDDKSLLYLQESHISEYIWRGELAQCTSILEAQEKEQQANAALNASEKRKLDYEKKLMNEPANLEQKKADEQMLKLAMDQKVEKERLHQRIIELQRELDGKLLLEVQINQMKGAIEVMKHMTDEDAETKKKLELIQEDMKRENEECHKRILELETQLDAKQALELEIEQRRGALMVMEHMERDEDKELWEKMKNMREELKDKEEELEMLEETSQALIIKERKTNDELQDARKELTNFLKDKSSRAHIGIKRMGEIDSSAFQKAAKRRYLIGEAENKAATLCSLWESHLADPNWHPFKIVAVGGNNGHKEIIDKEDAKLRSLRDDLGDEAYNAVITALMELNEYNPSGRYPVLEIWNHKEARKATLCEAVLDVVKQWRMLKRRNH